MSADAPAGTYEIRLFISGITSRSTRALENLRAVCDTQLAGRVHLEVIDLYQHPEMAKTAQIVAAPTVVRLSPLPVRRLIGDLSNHERLLDLLDLAPEAKL